MAGFGSPCGACKFLRRKCVRGCVFAPYFCHEQGAAQFAAIHKVFGASNVSKLLLHLPVSHRSEAALTIAYEAQARLHDPIYGCVAHIFALQQQVVTLEAQIASLKSQTSRLEEEESSNKFPQYEIGEDYFIPCKVSMTQSSISDANMNNPEVMLLHHDNGLLNSNTFRSSQHSYMIHTDQSSFTMDDNSSCAMTSLELQANAMRSTYHDMDDLHSVAFGHLNCA